jgi:hypothetical protein
VFPCRERDLRVIRPFVYVREKSLRQFAESRDLPVIPENCPACFEAPKVSTEESDDSVPVRRLSVSQTFFRGGILNVIVHILRNPYVGGGG